ncbi:MAG: hypothetical protein LBL96_10200 [Clostridiales bacterium]|nr:hypothetical protein [Clostridiales bacterium]
MEINKRRIVIMTKLAIYDKHFGPKDKKDNEYYRHDYIYRRNMWTRFCAGVGAVILLGFYWSYQLFALEQKVLALDYKQAGIDTAIFLLFVLAFYTIMGTIKEAREYASGQRRLKSYLRLRHQLDKQREPRRTEEEPWLYYGVNAKDSRNTD